MTLPTTRIITHLNPDISNGLERTEICLKAATNPFNRHKLITRAESEALEILRQRAVAAHSDNGRQQWNMFEELGRKVLAATPDDARQATVLHELNEIPERAQPFTDNIFLSQEAHSKAHRFRAVRAQVDAAESPRPALAMRHKPALHARAVTATGSMRDLYTVFTEFTQRYKLSSAEVGAACVGVKSGEPLDAIQVSGALSTLAHGKNATGPFASIAGDPDGFFHKLEAILTKRTKEPVTIPNDERHTLHEAIVAARSKQKALAR